MPVGYAGQVMDIIVGVADRALAGYVLGEVADFIVLIASFQQPVIVSGVYLLIGEAVQLIDGI